MVTGTMIVPVMDAIAKFLGDSMSPVQITWGRFTFQFIIMGMAIIPLYGFKALWPKRPAIHAVRGVLLAVATTFFFFSLQFLPLANAIAIFFVQPMLLTLLAVLFLGEKIGWHRKAAVLAGFLGALLVIQPGSDSFTLAALLPMCAAFFFSCYLVVTRSVANVDHPLIMQFASGFGATIALSLALLLGMLLDSPAWTPVVPDLPQWGWLMLIGVIAAAGHLLVVIAVNRAPASLLAPFGYVEIIAATYLGWLIFDEWPDTLSWLGIAVIVMSGLYVFVREQRQGSNSLEPTNG
ncbi:Riboflavin transporter [Granulosicoccus antarcticus IMCC3135]|uniref:Riboflavin transporter n=2 Tax=Granulosicoccus TaxID=437504 RepID=A0A2Z2NL55_9GAMM|nr:Riboflavin transporter [Granulosicoccus antarcticus IMCC3135]